MMEGRKVGSGNAFRRRSEITNYLFFILLIFLSSCQTNSFESREELMAYVIDPASGLTQHKTVNGMEYTLSYRPTDMLVQQMLSKNPSDKERDSLRKKYAQFLYFNISIAKNGGEILNNFGGSRTDYGAMVNKLAFGMSEKVHLFNESKDTVELLDYVYPREYGMGKSTNLMFVYPKDEKLFERKFMQLTIEDIGLGTGEVGFRILTKSIENEPTLNL